MMASKIISVSVFILAIVGLSVSYTLPLTTEFDQYSTSPTTSATSTEDETRAASGTTSDVTSHNTPELTLPPPAEATTEGIEDTTSSPTTTTTTTTTTLAPTTPLDPCNPPPRCTYAGQKIADPTNCTLYFDCGPGWEWEQEICGSGKLFDTVTNQCVPAENATCVNCQPYTGTTQAPGICDNENTTALCLEPGARVADKTSCYHYFQCFVPNWVRQECAVTGPVYDIYTKECIVPDENFDCSYRCVTPTPTTATTTTTTPTTTTTTTTVSPPTTIDPCNPPPKCLSYGQKMADPADCAFYYDCGAGWVWEHEQCPSDKLFDSIYLECVNEGATCAEPCELFTGSTTPTPAPGMCDAENNTGGACFENGARVADKTSCYHYYECFIPDWVRQECSVTGPVYDIYTQKCIHPDETFDCSYRCETPAPRAAAKLSPTSTPEMHVTMTLNGTFWTAAEITNSRCVNGYTESFRRSFRKTVSAAEDAIKRGMMCAQTRQVRLVDGPINTIAHDHMGKLEFNLDVLPMQPLTLAQEVESCASDVSQFVGNFVNWKQPIITAVGGCPAPTFNPQRFQQKAAQRKYDV